MSSVSESELSVCSIFFLFFCRQPVVLKCLFTVGQHSVPEFEKLVSWDFFSAEIAWSFLKQQYESDDLWHTMSLKFLDTADGNEYRQTVRNILEKYNIIIIWMGMLWYGERNLKIMVLIVKNLSHGLPLKIGCYFILLLILWYTRLYFKITFLKITSSLGKQNTNQATTRKRFSVFRLTSSNVLNIKL